MSPDVIEFIKDWLWGPMLGLIVWAWTRNEKEHESMRESHDKLKSQVSVGYSTMNDRVMQHIDDQVREVRVFVIAEDAKLLAELGVQRGHIGKLFDKLEEHGHRSEDRHRELMDKMTGGLLEIHRVLAGKADR